MAHPGTSCSKKMKTAAKIPFLHRKHHYMDHVWVVGFFPPFPLWKKNSRTSKPTASHRNQQGVKRFWLARFFFNTTCGVLLRNTEMAHPGTSIPKKWSVAPQNNLFHIGRDKRLSTFGRPGFPICLQHFAKSIQKPSKTTFGYFWGIDGGCQGTLRWHIQAYPAGERWKLLLKHAKTC